MAKDKITFGEFLEIESKLEITVGLVIEAIRIPKKDKLLQLTVDFGNDGVKTAVTNLGGTFEPIDLVGIKFPFITNLEPSKLGGVMSEAMIMVSSYENGTIELDSPTNGGKLM